MSLKNIKKITEQCIQQTQCEVDVRYNEPMNEHTTFKVGGPADCWICPSGEGFTGFCASLLGSARACDIPVFILGGGANIVVSDKGIRGIVLDMNQWYGESVWELFSGEEEHVLKSGTSIESASDTAAAAGLSGVEFLAGMPGTLGGAIWMNARCYGSEMADVLNWVEIMARDDTEKSEYAIKRIEIEDKAGFGYKRSPFQNMDCLIISASLKLKKSEKAKILVEMEKYREDRFKKGHYDFPCAGSAFKNNHDFGKPAGVIIDELGLKGFQIGGAQVAPFHGNIIINTGNATASDIRSLMSEVAARVKTATGFVLESEILFPGEWK